MGDLPRDEIMRLANDALAKAQGRAKIHFKFTCDHCGARVFFDEPNTLYESGECAVCGKTTKIEQAGFALELMIGEGDAGKTDS